MNLHLFFSLILSSCFINFNMLLLLLFLCCVLQNGALFHKKSGLGALPLALFNGIPLSPEEMDPDELEAVILQRIMDTTTAFQRAVFMVDTFKKKKKKSKSFIFSQGKEL